jgi:hypothetical protein
LRVTAHDAGATQPSSFERSPLFLYPPINPSVMQLRVDLGTRRKWITPKPPPKLERLNAEIKRRIDSISAFPDRASALRLITAVALEVTTLWAERRYLDMSLLSSPEAKAA